MIPTSQPAAKTVHPLARFVTKEAVTLLLNLKPEEVYRISCWRYVIHVVGKGVSTFVSYADLPPITEVEPPTKLDLVYWRKRWKQNHILQAPNFWVEFYQQKFCQSLSTGELHTWGRLVSVIKFGLSSTAVQQLRSVYLDVKYSLESSTKIAA